MTRQSSLTSKRQHKPADLESKRQHPLSGASSPHETAAGRCKTVQLASGGGGGRGETEECGDKEFERTRKDHVQPRGRLMIHGCAEGSSGSGLVSLDHRYALKLAGVARRSSSWRNQNRCLATRHARGRVQFSEQAWIAVPDRGPRIDLHTSPLSATASLQVRLA